MPQFASLDGVPPGSVARKSRAFVVGAELVVDRGMLGL